MIDPRLQLRALAALGLLVVAFVGLIGRLWTIQVGSPDAWAAAGTAQHETGVRRLSADRGAITDRHGRVFARTEERPSVAIDPQVAARSGHLDALAEIVRDEIGADLFAAIADAPATSQFVWVARKLGDRDAVERLRRRAIDADLDGLIVQHEPVRAYPSGSLASHLVGFTFEDPARGLVGAEGTERLIDDRLRGRDGRVACERDVRGRWIVRSSADVVAPRPGADVALTIDAVVQAFCEDEVQQVWDDFAPVSAVAAVVDVRTGEVLAAASRPTFDPNDRNAPAEMRRNRFFTDIFEPGSTFKPIAMAIAIDAGEVSSGEIIQTSPGTIKVGRRTIREDKHKDLGALTPAGILARSSNVGMAIIAQRVGIPRMHAAVRLFGFGAFTGTGWTGESKGKITSLPDWTESYTLCSVSFGQEIAVTPAQLLAGYAALANGGRLRPLRVFLDVPARSPIQVIRPEAAERVVPMLEDVFLSGTAKGIDTGGYRLGGKTGTAEQKDRRGNAEYVGSFGCIGPIEAPRLAVLVVCNRPANGKPYGSRVAAPNAVRLMRSSLRYLGVTPRPRPLDAEGADQILEVKPR